MALKSQHINVFLRIRPTTTQERRSPKLLEVVSTKEVNVKNSYGKKYSFDKIFDEFSKQNEVYESVVHPLIKEVLNGYNCTVFAYGQTGTGKTYTMTGDANGEEGLIPRAISNIFDKLNSASNESSITVSYIELYNEEVYDLLSAVDRPIRMFEDKQQKGSVILQGIDEIMVKNKQQVFTILDRGAEKRRTATTLMNNSSSRSHTVFTITVHTREMTLQGEELLKTGKLYLVDLAGSENISRSGAVDKRAREAGNINQSLLTLGRVINALTEKSMHIPYRDSKLTRLLQDSLGGRTKTSLVATVSASVLNNEETLSTLEYATRARSIQNRPEINQRISKTALMSQLRDDVSKLKRDLDAARTQNGVYLDEANYNEMINQLDHQKGELTSKMNFIKELQQRIDETNGRLTTVESNWKETLHVKEALESDKEKLLIEKEMFERKNEKLQQNEVILHSKLSNLYKTSDDNRNSTVIFNEVFGKMMREMRTNLERFIDRLLNVTSCSADAVDEHDNSLKNFYQVITSNLNDIESLARELEDRRDAYVTERESGFSPDEHFVEVYRMMTGTCKEIKKFVRAVKDEGLTKISQIVKNGHDLKESGYNNLISNLFRIQKIITETLSATVVISKNFEDVVKDIGKINERARRCKDVNASNRNGNSFIEQQLKMLQEKEREVYELRMNTFGKILETLTRSEENHALMDSYVESIEETSTTLRGAINDNLNVISESLSTRLRSTESDVSEVTNNVQQLKATDFAISGESVQIIDKLISATNNFEQITETLHNSNNKKLAENQHRSRANEETIDAYLKNFHALTNNINRTAESALAAASDFYSTDLKFGEDLREATAETTSRATENRAYVVDKAATLQEHVERFYGVELTHPTHAGDTPQCTKRRSYVNDENSDPNVKRQLLQTIADDD